MHELYELAPNTRFCVGGLPEELAALQRLQHLQLGNCVTAPLTQSISCLTQLTHLEITQNEQDHDDWDVLDKVMVRRACCSNVHDAGTQQRGWMAGMHSVLNALVVLVQALPASLQVLQAARVPVILLAQLTALEFLTLEDTISHAAAATCSLSVLGRLTMLQMGRSRNAELDMIGGCTSHRTLYLRSTSFGQAEATGSIALAAACVANCLPSADICIIMLRRTGRGAGNAAAAVLSAHPTAAACWQMVDE